MAKKKAEGPRPGVHPELASLVEDFLARKTAPSTRRAYRQALLDFLGGVEGLKSLREMDHRNVTEWRNSLLERGNSKPTVNQKLAAVRGLLDFLVSLELLKHNAAGPKLVPGFRVSDESKTPGLSAKEARQLVASCDDGTPAGRRDKAIVLLGLLQGLRRSEIAGLTVGSLRKEPLEDPGGASGVVEVLHLRDTKTSDFARSVLDPRAARAVHEYLDDLGRSLKPKDPIFFSLSTAAKRKALRPLTPAAVNLIIQSRARKAGLKRISAHSLRHTCTTLALDGGAKLERVQAHLRHRDPRTTIRYYRNLRALRNDAARHIRL